MPTIPRLDEYQPRFTLYMLDKKLNPGDRYTVYEYIIWVSRFSSEFKKMKKMHHTDILPPSLQDEFTEYIKSKIT